LTPRTPPLGGMRITMKNHTDYLKGCGTGVDIDKSLTLAYYFSSAGDHRAAEGHYDDALRYFERLAGKLGYRVVKIDPSMPAEPARADRQREAAE
jgi:hypothetical protein